MKTSRKAKNNPLGVVTVLVFISCSYVAVYQLRTDWIFLVSLAVSFGLWCIWRSLLDILSRYYNEKPRALGTASLSAGQHVLLLAAGTTILGFWVIAPALTLIRFQIHYRDYAAVASQPPKM